MQKYAGYLGQDPRSEIKISYAEIMPYVSRMMDLEVSDTGIHDILKKTGIAIDIWPITGS